MPKTRGDESTQRLKEIWAQNVRFAIAKLGITQVELAKKVGVSPQMITDWKGGEVKPGEIPAAPHPPSVENLLSFAKAVKEPVSWLIGDGFHGKNSVGYLSHQLTLRLGYERLAALIEIPEAEMIDEIDRIIGRALIRSRKPKKPKR